MRNLAKTIDQAVHQGVADALTEHKTRGQDVYIMRSGRVVRVKADMIKVDEPNFVINPKSL